MSEIQSVRCPNCGDMAERKLIVDITVPGCDKVVETACPKCDYFMVIAWPLGKVIEAYAPGQAACYPGNHLNGYNLSVLRYSEIRSSDLTRLAC